MIQRSKRLKMIWQWDVKIYCRPMMIWRSKQWHECNNMKIWIWDDMKLIGMKAAPSITWHPSFIVHLAWLRSTKRAQEILVVILSLLNTIGPLLTARAHDSFLSSAGYTVGGHGELAGWWLPSSTTILLALSQVRVLLKVTSTSRRCSVLIAVS